MVLYYSKKAKIRVGPTQTINVIMCSVVFNQGYVLSQEKRDKAGCCSVVFTRSRFFPF